MRHAVTIFKYTVFFFVCFILAPITAIAETTSTTVTGPLMVFGIVVDTAFVLSMLTSVVIPLITSFLGRQHWGAWLGFITLAIATLNGFLTEWAQSSDRNHYDWKHALLIALGSYLFAVMGRLNIWKGTEIDRKALAVGEPKTAQATATA